jgi:hypothetical protein
MAQNTKQYTEPRVQLSLLGHTWKRVWGRKTRLTRGFVLVKFKLTFKDMNLKKKLSWKFLLFGGVILWLIGEYIFNPNNVIGASIATIGGIMALMGIVNLPIWKGKWNKKF